MIKGLLGCKVGMTQVFAEDGRVIPVSVIKAGPCDILQVKSLERDGYEAVQLGFGDKPRRLANRAERGHLVSLDSKRQKRRSAGGISPIPKADCEPKRFVRELRGASGECAVGSTLTVGVFTEVVAVDVVGVSKGRGTAGAMKRHNFSGQRASHGVKKCHRHLGSTGCSAWPSRVIKGKKMPGRYGAARCTVRNLRVVSVDEENSLLIVRGAIPGPNGGYVIIRETNRLPRPLSDAERAERDAKMVSKKKRK